MKLSIILVIENQDQDLYPCMRCLLKQSSQDFEIIAINFGSIDKTKARLDFYSQLYPSFVHVTHLTHCSKAEAYQIGLDQAKGETVLFLNPTHWLKYRAIETYIQEIDKSHADMVFLKKGSHKRQLYSGLRKDVLQPRTACKKVLSQEITEQIEGVLIRRELLISNPIVDHPFFSSISCIQLMLASTKIVLLPYHGLENNPNMTKPMAIASDCLQAWQQAQRMKMAMITNYDLTLVHLCKMHQRKQSLSLFTSFLTQGHWESQLLNSNVIKRQSEPNFQKVSQV